MKNLILATVAALALGITGAGIGQAQAAGATPSATRSSSSATMHRQQTVQAPKTRANPHRTTSGSGLSLVVHTRPSNAGTSGGFSLKPHTRSTNNGSANAGSSGAEHQGSSPRSQSSTR